VPGVARHFDKLPSDRLRGLQNRRNGGSKAEWFRRALGFTKDNAERLANQIIFDRSKAVQTAVTEFGTKFNQTIAIQGANGKTIDVLFAWIQNKDGVVRLVTSVPGD